jgi:hypothetical protein
MAALRRRSAGVRRRVQSATVTIQAVTKDQTDMKPV